MLYNTIAYNALFFLTICFFKDGPKDGVLNNSQILSHEENIDMLLSGSENSEIDRELIEER